MPAKGIIKVNSIDYAMVLFEDGSIVHESRPDDFSQEFRQGPQSPQALGSYQSLIFPHFANGLGRDRIASDSALTRPAEYTRFFDATADTRFISGVYLPILEEDSTHTGLEKVRASAEFKGDLWTLWEDDTSTDIVARKYTGSTTTFEGGGDVLADATTKVIFDLFPHQTHLISLMGNANDHLIHRSTDGATWTAASTQPTANLLSNNVTAHEFLMGGLLAEIGGEVVAMIFDEVSAELVPFTSTDAGDNWTGESGGRIPVGSGCRGIAVMAGIDNEDKLYVGTDVGIWEIDTAPATWTERLVVPMPRNDFNCQRMTIGPDGALWFSQSGAPTEPPIVRRLVIRNGERLVESVPNDFSLGDGIPAEAAGRVRWMVADGVFMYMASGGVSTGDFMRIWCHNGRGWHSVRRNGTENQELDWLDISSADDNTPRLHYAIATSSSISDANFLAQPSADPSSGVSIKREAAGFIDLPFIDFGHPHESKNVLRVGINGKDFSSTNSNQHVNVDFGSASDLGTPTARGSFTNLGDFLSGVSRITLPTASDLVGLSARTFALRVNLLRGSTNTNTPVVFDVGIDGYVVLTDTDMLQFRVDLKETRDLLKSADIDPLTNLLAARASGVLVPVTYADFGTKQMRITQVEFQETVKSGDSFSPASSDPNARRNGIALVTAVEVI